MDRTGGALVGALTGWRVRGGWSEESLSLSPKIEFWPQIGVGWPVVSIGALRVSRSDGCAIQGSYGWEAGGGWGPSAALGLPWEAVRAHPLSDATKQATNTTS